MTFDEWASQYNGKAIDYDGGCGVQCVDLAKLYMDKVLGVTFGAIGNAEAYYRRYNELSALKNNFERIPNTASFIPQKGDIVVWGLKLSKYGHIAIANGEGTTNWFKTYDQNWNGKKMKIVQHNYKGVDGVLRPRNLSNIFPPAPEPEPQKPSYEDIGYFLLDMELYNLLHIDLQNAFHGDINALKEHFYLCGIKENRRASYVFNPEYYYNKYEDLRKAFGNNSYELFKHFVTCGIKEGRQGSQEFDINFYKANNPDLANRNNEDIMSHFLLYGINEFRQTSAEFNVNAYRNANVDLNNAFGNNSKEYYKHYIMFGKNEGRKCV